MIKCENCGQAYTPDNTIFAFYGDFFKIKEYLDLYCFISQNDFKNGSAIVQCSIIQP